MKKFPLVLPIIILGLALFSSMSALARTGKETVPTRQTDTAPATTNPRTKEQDRSSPAEWGKPPLAYAVPNFIELSIVQNEIEALREEVAALRKAQEKEGGK